MIYWGQYDVPTLVIGKLLQTVVDNSGPQTKPYKTNRPLALQKKGKKIFYFSFRCYVLFQHHISASAENNRFLAFIQLIHNKRRNTCCLLLKTCARCFPTSAERFRQTHQGLSMTLAAASKDAGHVRAATIPVWTHGRNYALTWY